jgi:hypothetical protein
MQSSLEIYILQVEAALAIDDQELGHLNVVVEGGQV